MNASLPSIMPGLGIVRRGLLDPDMPKAFGMS